MTTVLVAGGGGFIGHHLVKYLVARGYRVRAVDVKPPEYEPSAAHDFQLLDLRLFENCLTACRGVEEVYQLAADMGGIGYISHSHAEISRNNVLINANLLEASRRNKVERHLFSSSACVYPQHLQTCPTLNPLKETDAWPADPEPGYGLEKLFSEKLCEYYLRDYGLQTRVVRLHNVFGPLGTYEGGREKAPAAVCRKIALAAHGDEIEVWGDGEQTRSFMYIDDCVEGLHRLMRSEYELPLNLGREEMVTINGLFDMVAAIAGRRIVKAHDLTKPQGVRGRTSDNQLVRHILNWEPGVRLQSGLELTYSWIESQLRLSARIP